MSTLKTHNLQGPDAGSVNIAMTPNAGMVVTGISTFTGAIDVDGHTNLDNVSIAGITSHQGDVAITTRGTVEGVSKLNVEIPSRTTAFSASDGDTWHDVLIENPGGATNNAVGLCFQVTGDSYHKNAGTGIAAVKNGTNSDYGADLVFITRPQSAVAQERLRIRSDGNIGIGNNVADANWKLKLVVPDNSSYQSAFNVTNNSNSDFNVVIKSNVTAIGNGTNNPLVFFTLSLIHI